MHRLVAACCLLAFPLLLLEVSVARGEEEPITWIIDTVAGTGRAENNGDEGEGVKSNIGQPFGVEVGPDGALYITEVINHRVRRLDLKSGRISTVAGNGQKGYSGDGGAATAARLNEPYEVRFDGDGNMFFVEMKNHLIRRVDAKTGLISTIAGTGKPGEGGDGGPAVKAQFNHPHSIALDGRGGLIIADIGNHRIRRVDLKSNVVETIAGAKKHRLPKDGQRARGNPILGPRALFVDKQQTLWIALREGHSVWKMALDEGVLRHVSGSGNKGFAGDGSEAKSAEYNGPKGIAVAEGMAFLVDTENQAIREIDIARGRVRTIAGGGPKSRGGKGDSGIGSSAQLDRPHGICVAPNGHIFIGDTLNHRVRRLRPHKPRRLSSE